MDAVNIMVIIFGEIKMSSQDIINFDFYDMRAACRKYKEQDALLGETA